MQHAFRTAIAAAVLALCAATAMAADADRGRKLAYACMGCHGIEHYKNAYPKYSVPKLGGQSAEYLVAALAAYEAKTRWHPTMQGYAATLSAEDRDDLAAYFHSLPTEKAAPQPVGTPPEAATTCSACHGNTGKGTIDENPTLSGQHADYLAQALNDYRLGKRENPVMGSFAKALTPAEIKALAEYFSKQPGLTTPEQ
jgi:cytochrome c553